MAVMRRCNHPTCNALISFNQAYCDKHKPYVNDKYNDVRRRNDPEYLRFYKSRQWQRMREIVLMENDYICRSCGRQAQMVDHIIPTKVDWSKRLEKENLQPLCYKCHNQKTKREQKEVPHIKERG
ncbi:HNH endonuclease [Staphylococcus chromogenes]|uniref:HNH endonuclease n=1 Tax=Staphylococcus chromogenes TaxID=46126 RepID=UPI000D1C98D6|nr:HNH endonuclease [Staphylococcus chromogenes]PTF51533.1 HNH endonuclease [Staphylococcus chromogenes]